MHTRQCRSFLSLSVQPSCSCMSNRMTIYRIFFRKCSFLSRLSDINNVINDSGCATFASNLASMLSEIPPARLSLILRLIADTVYTPLVIIIIPPTQNRRVFVYGFGVLRSNDGYGKQTAGSLLPSSKDDIAFTSCCGISLDAPSRRSTYFKDVENLNC